MPGVRFSEIVAAGLGCLMASMACQGNFLPGAQAKDDPAPLAAYRDSLLDIDMEYPEGWVPDVKKTFANAGTTWNVYFEPPNTLATRRFTLKIIQPDQPDTLRTLADFKAEFLERLASGRGDLKIVDSGSVTLGGEPGFEAEYITYLNGKPYVRFLELICVRPAGLSRPGRDVSLSFETAEENADEDLLLFSRVADRFRFYSP